MLSALADAWRRERNLVLLPGLRVSDIQTSISTTCCRASEISYIHADCLYNGLIGGSDLRNQPCLGCLWSTGSLFGQIKPCGPLD